MNETTPLARTQAAHPPISASFEFFPPKNQTMEDTLWASIQRLEPLRPRFVSVTYGAGGSTRERTHRTVKRIIDETSLRPAAHLTCVGATKDEVNEVIRDYWAAGIRHIVALRGDPPAGAGTAYTPHPGGYANGAELTAGIRAVGDFEVSVSAYPERHPDSADWSVEMDNLKRKQDAGATRAITQFFFENDLFEAYLERVAKAGVTLPIVPGIVPVHNFQQVARFSAACGTTVPAWLERRFEGLDDDAETRRLVAAAVAAEQVLDLNSRGITDFHFYTMNRSELVYALCHLLGLRADAQIEAAA